MLNAIVAALTALPELITLGKQLYGFYMTMTGQTVKEKGSKYLKGTELPCRYRP